MVVRSPRGWVRGWSRCRPTTPGQKAKSTVIGQHQEDDGHHHQDLLAGGDLDQLAAPGLADVGGLRVQHVGQRRAALDGDRDALGEAGDERQPGRRGHPVEGGADRLAGADRRRAPEPRSGESSPPLRRTTRSSAPTGLSPGGHGEGEQLGDGRELGEDPALARRTWLVQVGVAGEHAEHERDRAQHQPRPARRPGSASSRSTPYAAATAKADQPPDHLLDAELVHGLVEVRRARGGGVPRWRRRAPARRVSAAERSTGPKTPAAAEVGEDERDPQRRACGRPAAGRGRRAAPGPRAAGAGSPGSRGDDQQQPGGERRPRATAPHAPRLTTGSVARWAAGRSASSAGRRPRRRPAPTTSTSTPARRGVAVDDLGLEGHEQQHQPRRRDGEPGAVDRPGLARLHLRAGAGVVAQVARQVAQQPAELAAADLAGDPQALDDPVADRVGQPRP